MGNTYILPVLIACVAQLGHGASAFALGDELGIATDKDMMASIIGRTYFFWAAHVRPYWRRVCRAAVKDSRGVTCFMVFRSPLHALHAKLFGGARFPR